MAVSVKAESLLFKHKSCILVYFPSFPSYFSVPGCCVCQCCASYFLHALFCFLYIIILDMPHFPAVSISPDCPL